MWRKNSAEECDKYCSRGIGERLKPGEMRKNEAEKLKNDFSRGITERM
jgi:hypothetical protein